MKKSILLALALPLILGGCGPTSTAQDSDGNGTESSNQTTGETTTGGTETGGQTETKTTTVSKDVGDFNLTNGEKPQTLNVNEDISLSLSKGSNTTNPPAYYTSDDTLRFYPGNTLKVTSTKGSVTKIEFNYDGAGFSCSNGSLSDKVWTGSASEILFTESGSKGNTKLYSIKITYGGTSGGGGTTGGGGGTETGGGGGGTTGGGGGTVTTTDYTSTWPSNYQQYVITYLNGAVPCFLNSNKNCLFNTIDTGTEEGSGLPYFNPSIQKTSPGINYEYDYSVILHDAGFTDDGDDKNEGVTWHNYVKGNYLVRFAKYLSDDNIYVFDAYMFYDYYNTTTFAKTYTFQHDDKNLALAGNYASNNKTVNVNGWKITLTDIMKQSYWMQLKSNSGKIVIEGSVKGVFLEILRNSDAAFVKAGTSSSTAKYIFNNGYRFDFPEGTKYVEISAQSRVLEFELFEVGY